MVDTQHCWLGFQKRRKISFYKKKNTFFFKDINTLHTCFGISGIDVRMFLQQLVFNWIVTLPCNASGLASEMCLTQYSTTRSPPCSHLLFLLFWKPNQQCCVSTIRCSYDIFPANVSMIFELFRSFLIAICHVTGLALPNCTSLRTYRR